MAGLFAFISSKKLNYLDSEPTGYPELITQFLLLTIDSLSFPKLGSLLLKRVGLGGIRFNKLFTGALEKCDGMIIKNSY